MRTSLMLLAAIIAGASASRTEDPQSILRETRSKIPLVLMDVSIGKPVVADEVEVHEPIVCERAPCPARRVWSAHPDASGIVLIPREVVRENTLVVARGHVAREIVVSEWTPDRSAWMLEVIPTAVTKCQGVDTPWAVLLPADGRSAEVLGVDGRAGRFAVLRCRNESGSNVVRRCASPDVSEGGYRTTFSRSRRGVVSVRVATAGLAGSQEIARLTCMAIPE